MFFFCYLCSEFRNHGPMSKKSIRFFNDRETFMKGIDYSYYYEQADYERIES